MDLVHKNGLDEQIMQNMANSKILYENTDILKRIDRNLEHGFGTQQNQHDIHTRMLQDANEAIERLIKNADNLTSMSNDQGRIITEQFAQLQKGIEGLPNRISSECRANEPYVSRDDPFGTFKQNGGEFNNHPPRFNKGILVNLDGTLCRQLCHFVHVFLTTRLFLLSWKRVI